MPVHLQRAVADEARSPAGRGTRTSPRSRTARPAPIVASVPESDAIIPVRICSVAREPVRRRAGVGGEDRAVGQSRRQLPERRAADSSGRRPCIARSSTTCHQSRDARPRPARARSGLLALEQRDGASRSVSARVADEVHVDRVADADHARPSMSIWTHVRLPLLGQELGVREARADHQQRVAALHQLVARLRAEQPDRAGHERQVVRQRRLARAAPWRRRRRAARRPRRPRRPRPARPGRPASRPSRPRSGCSAAR